MQPIKYINEVEALDTKEMKWVTDMPAYPGDPIGRFNAGHIKTTLDGKNVVMFFGVRASRVILLSCRRRQLLTCTPDTLCFCGARA